jgi:hypothetical protein
VRYFSTERFFTGFGTHNMVRSEPVFRTDDFTDDECKALVSSVQRELEEINGMTEGELYFELGPSADEDLEEFIILKSKWTVHADQIEKKYGERGSCWQYDMHLLNEIARQHAEIIRGLKRHSCPTAFLQCHLPSGAFSTFARVDCLSDREFAVLIDVLTTELNRIGTTLRVITDWHAMNEPQEYVQAKLDYDQYSSPGSVANEVGSAYEFELAAEHVFDRCIEEVKQLRFIATEGLGNDFSIRQASPPIPQVEKDPSETLLASYRDPDNYWRNVWLYEQRKAGKTNPAILAELAERAQEFAPLESENALRSSIDSIAEHHCWPQLKGRAGRPRLKSPATENPQCISENHAVSD